MWWLGLTLFASGAWIEPISAPDNVKAAQCRAAADIIRDVVLPSGKGGAQRRIVFDPTISMYGETISPWSRFVGPETPSPPARLLSSLNNHVEVSAVASCSEVRSFLKSQDVPFDRRSVKSGYRLKQNLESRALVLAASLPALSDDGRQALFMNAMRCGGRCGVGELVHVSRDRTGKWRLVRQYTLWVS